MQSLSSKLLEKAVEQFASLPGIGRKTALRYVLHMLRQSPEDNIISNNFFLINQRMSCFK